MTDTILESLKENGMIEMETENSSLIILFRKFYGTEKEFLFMLNYKAVDGCKTKRIAIKKINQFLDKGFKLTNA